MLIVGKLIGGVLLVLADLAAGLPPAQERVACKTGNEPIGADNPGEEGLVEAAASYSCLSRRSHLGRTTDVLRNLRYACYRCR